MSRSGPDEFESTSDNVLLAVSGLTVRADHRVILQDVSFTMRRGDTPAVIGPNGAGKTTLFRALLGLVPYDGRIAWHRRGPLGYIPQRFEFDRVATTAALFGMLARATLVPDVAQSEGVPVGVAEGVYLVMLALAVAIGIKIVGTLLMGALIILPASTAKNLASDLRAMTVLAVVLGIVTTGIGLSVATAWHWPPGPAAVLANATLFLVSAVRSRTV